jgi:uncharacterized protein
MTPAANDPGADRQPAADQPPTRPAPSPPPAPAPPPAAPEPRSASLTPTSAAGREPILDALRGAALLGILLVNIHLMRGPDLWRIIAGETLEPTGTADRVVAALTGWLVAGKFIASFALLFGVGAALIAGRAVRAGRRPRPVLVRRYLWLLLFGLAHMVLLFPGDILFLYGLAGLLLVLFLAARTSTVRAWAAGLLTVSALVASLLAAAGAAVAGGGPTGPSGDVFGTFVRERGEQAVAAFTEGGYLDVIVANAWQAVFVQTSQLVLLPWVLALFLLGFCVGRAGWIDDLGARRPELRRLAAIGLGVGLPLNLPLIASGTLGADGPGAQTVASEPLRAFGVTFAQLAGAPLLAVGYLAAAALVFLRIGAPRRLAAVGRTALSGYLLQSALALLVFAGLGFYGELSAAASLVVVGAIWTVLLVACPWWLRSHRFGPAEWVWRAVTYRGG